MARNVYNGRCKVCGMLFVGMDRAEYNHIVTRHISQEHPRYDATKVMESL